MPGPVDIAIRVAINAVAFVAAVLLVPGAEFLSDPWKIALIAAIFGVINAYLRPIVKLLSLPLNLISFGLVGLVINVGMVFLTGVISGQMRLGFRLGGWPRTDFTIETVTAALGVALVVSVVATILALVRRLLPRV
jgi:putative membrane protein